MPNQDELIKAFDRGFDDGKAIGVKDRVAQDEARMELAMRLLIAEAYNIVMGGEHQCPESGPLAGTAATDWKCRTCCLVSVVSEISVNQSQPAPTPPGCSVDA